MKKSLIILLLVFGVVTLVGAQENNSEELSKEESTYQKFKFSLNFGKSLSTPIQSLSGYNSSIINPLVPSVYGVSEYSNPASNMIGLEFRYMFKKNWSLNLTGLGILSGQPSQDAIQGVYDSEAGVNVIPDIRSVAYKATYDWNAEIGVSHYFDLPNKKLLPYVGASFIVMHGLSFAEATMEILDTPYGGEPDILDVFRGEQSLELLTWGFALPIGAEYKIADGLFIGLSINAANYFYSLSSLSPGEGMELAQAQNVTTSFFTRPMFKLGIEF